MKLGKGIHALIITILLSGIYFYASNYIENSSILLIVVIISLVTSEAVKLIPSYSLLRNTDDKFWMYILMYGLIITPGAVWRDNLIDSLVGLGIMISLYILPCMIWYKLANKYADTPPMLWTALRNFYLNKYEVLDKYYKKNYLYAFKLDDSNDYVVFSYFREIHTYLQVIRTKGDKATALVPLDLDSQSYIKLEWTIGGLDKTDLNDEFEGIYTLMDTLDSWKFNGFTEDEIVTSLESSMNGTKYQISRASRYEYERCGFTRHEL